VQEPQKQNPAADEHQRLPGEQRLSAEVAALVAAAGAAGLFAEKGGGQKTSGIETARASAGDKACWKNGFTYARCCEVPSIVAQIEGCWAGDFNETRCCGRRAKADEQQASETDAHSGQESLEGETEEQVTFFKREAERRWASYFSRAHQTLDVAQGGRSDVDGNSAGGQDDLSRDMVQVYHMLYEVVNQLVGGLQLAAEAETSGPDMAPSSLRAAFLSAAVVLARLAQASRGTPLEHEDFESQASAAVTLSCRNHGAQVKSCQNLAQRLTWLQSQKGLDANAVSSGNWHNLLETLERRLNGSVADGMNLEPIFQRSWHMYAEDLAQAVWRPAAGHQGQEDATRTPRTSTFNPLEKAQLQHGQPGVGDVWLLFPTYVMAKELGPSFSSASTQEGCAGCGQLSKIVLRKYHEFRDAIFGGAGEDNSARRARQDEVNNAFFNWQLTHESEQQDLQGQQQWPELYRDSKEFTELKNLVKLACLEYLQQIYAASLSALDLAQLELSIWASVTPSRQPDVPEEDSTGGRLGLAFHDHPLALLSGVFYVQAGGKSVAERTPTVFADPRGTTPFRYTRSSRVGGQSEEATLEPTAPFHRLAYAHASDGLAIVFPSWLVHGVPPHHGSEDRVVFAFNLHTLQGTTLSSWAKTTL